MQQHCPDCGDFCASIIHQTVDVGLPISLLPAVCLGDIKVVCSGEPQVECCRCRNGCGGLELMITQIVTYKIPIEYRAEAIAGDVTSECKKCCPSTNCQQYRY